MSSRIVKEIMTINPVTVSPDDHVTVAFKIIEDNKVRQAPVISNGQLVGIITDRDLRMTLVQEDINNRNITVSSVMTRDPVTVYENSEIEEAANKISEHRVNSLPVVTGENRLCGIVTTIDIIKELIRK